MMYFPALDSFYESSGGLLDVLEIEPQTLWLHTQGVMRLDDRAFSGLQRWPQRKLVHGVGMPLAATVEPDSRQLAPWCDSITRLQCPWASEHLAFQRVPDSRAAGASEHSGFLLPALQCAESVALAAARIDALQRTSGVPIAFENSPNYLRPKRSEIPDGEFYARVAEKADCGILLDLHNLWCNEQNGRQSMRQVMQCLPLERVWEIHLAGGERRDGYWLDAHSDLVPPQVMEFCEEWLPRLPHLGAMIFEIIPEYIEAKGIPGDQLAAQLEAMRVLWRRRREPHTGPGARLPANGPAAEACEPQPTLSAANWERALGALVNGREMPQELRHLALAQDPGVRVLRSLVESFRAGTLADGLTLSYRLLVLTLGDESTSLLMAEFWREQWPQPFVTDEMRAFADFLRARIIAGRLDVPHLRSVLDYELSVTQTLDTGREDRVNFDCEPLTLLSALARGEVPESLVPGNFELHVKQ